MSEFEFLEKMFRRLSECRRFVTDAENEQVREASETSEVMIACTIKDYLEMRKEQQP